MTWITVTQEGPKPISVSHPTLSGAKAIYDAFVSAKVHVRLWAPDNTLLTPNTRSVQ